MVRWVLRFLFVAIPLGFVVLGNIIGWTCISRLLWQDDTLAVTVGIFFLAAGFIFDCFVIGIYLEIFNRWRWRLWRRHA